MQGKKYVVCIANEKLMLGYLQKGKRMNFGLMSWTIFILLGSYWSLGSPWSLYTQNL